MEVSDVPGSRCASASGATNRTSEPRGRRRVLVRVCAGVVALGGVSGTTAAHGAHGTGGEPATFAIVVTLPVVAGLAGGAIIVRQGRASRTNPAGLGAETVLGVLLVVLGATVAISAVTANPHLGAGGGALGTVAALWATRREATATRGEATVTHGCEADLALGAVSTHRVFEGVALGTLYGAGIAVGLLGAIVLAAHNAIETAVVGRLYISGRRRSRAVGAVVLLQAVYTGGALAGLGVSGVVPSSLRLFGLAVAGGALLVVGVGETGRSLAAGRRVAPE